MASSGGAALRLLQKLRDGLVAVDLQCDFLCGGASGVPDGEAVIAPGEEYLARALSVLALPFSPAAIGIPAIAE